ARLRASFVLQLSGLAFGVIHDALAPSSWRRDVRAEFRRALRQSVGGGLSTTIVTAALIGLAMVYQTLYWLGEAGQEELIGWALVTRFVAGSLLQSMSVSIWSFLDRVLLAMTAADFLVFPAKMLAIGLLVALTTCLTGLRAGPRDDATQLLPRGFVRGVLAILL